ncbi:MAG TPA: winged helix-turn-helix domain-containing protein [Blastocatellia bacterium]|nr:winged helix-turn-helix domain-containing protein [Blastocatellia bacterium]
MASVERQVRRFYEFGPFRLVPDEQRMYREGEVVRLSPRVFELLLLLARNAGQVMDREGLISTLWPDTVVEEANLNVHISALRKALGESPGGHQYIETLPRLGYRFVASVREMEADGGEFNGRAPDKSRGPAASVGHASNGSQLMAADTVTQDEGASSVNRQRGLAVALTALVIGVTTISFVVYLARTGSRVDQPPPQRKLWQLTFDSGLNSEPTWSPDGRLIAYSADRDGNFDIWVQPVGEGNPVRVTTSPAHDWQPDWAPEGNRLVFRSERDGGGLFVVPVLGGNERRVSGFGYRPRWSPDGTQILFSSILRPVTEIPKVYVVGLDGKPPQELMTSFLPQFTMLNVAWHPDGRRISVWGNHQQHGLSFWTVPLAGGTPVRSELAPPVEQRLREADVRFTSFQWSPSGRALYFEGTSGGVKNLWKVEVDPQSLRWTAGPERLTTGTGQDTDLTVSPDGRRLAFTARTESTRLWSLPFDATGRVRGAGKPVTAPGMDAFYPDLSPDGQRLVYLAQRVGKEELREKSLRDGHETLLMAAEELISAHPRWSPDGRRLAYDRSRPPQPGFTRKESAIYLLPAGSGESQMITTPGTTSEIIWDWSADGQWILGGSYSQSPWRRLICLFPTAAAPHAETQMRVVASDPEQNLYQARYSPDNRWISFVAARAFEAGVSTIHVLPAGGGEWKRITEGKYFDDKPRWSPDGRKLYFISNRTGFFNVWCIGFDPATGQPVGEPFRVTTFESPGQMIEPDVTVMEMTLSADRIILPIMEVSGGIWILENVGR